jgi:translation initiation factor 1
MAKEAAKIKVYTVRRRFGKWVTVVEGISKDSNPKQISKKLKSKLACGGTFKDNKIELQGEHKEAVRKVLENLGFSKEQIQVE